MRGRQGAMSPPGTSRHFAATQQCSRFRSEANIQRAVPTEADLRVRAPVSRIGSSPEFLSLLRSEFPNQSDTSKHMIPVSRTRSWRRVSAERPRELWVRDTGYLQP